MHRRLYMKHESRNMKLRLTKTTTPWLGSHATRPRATIHLALKWKEPFSPPGQNSYLTPSSRRRLDTPTAAHPQISHTSSVSTALLNHKPHTVMSRRRIIARVEVLTAMLLKIRVFWGVMLSQCPSFRRVIAFVSSGSRNQDVCVIVKMTALRSFKLFTGGHCVTKHLRRLGLSY